MIRSLRTAHIRAFVITTFVAPLIIVMAAGTRTNPPLVADSVIPHDELQDAGEIAFGETVIRLEVTRRDSVTDVLHELVSSTVPVPTLALMDAGGSVTPISLIREVPTRVSFTEPGGVVLVFYSVGLDSVIGEFTR